uniref:Uncharacterized protein n=1 Tax=Arundo donax TaxID=35708 RepID=A0A0A9GNJ7_ARUDO
MRKKEKDTCQSKMLFTFAILYFNKLILHHCFFQPV